MAGLRRSRDTDCGRQFSLARSELDRELYLCCGYWRSAPRFVPASDRPCARLLCRPHARDFDQPYHGNVQRRVHAAEHVGLERHAALHGDSHRDRLRHDGEPAHGRRLDGACGILVIAMFRLAAAGRPLHHEFANRAAAVDGEMVDVVGNMPLVWSFCGIGREHSRLDVTIDREMAARRRSLLYLEKLRLFHAVVTVVLIIALLAWAIVLWQNGAATAGDVVLVCTLGLSILPATRDLAVAMVDVTQPPARLPAAVASS